MKYLTFKQIILFFFILISPSLIFSETLNTKYKHAEAAYQKLKSNKKKQAYRSNWIDCINNYKKIYDYNPDSSLAPSSLYMAAVLYYDLSKKSFRKSDKDLSIQFHKKLIKKFPDSLYRKKSDVQLKYMKGKNTGVKDNISTKSSNSKQLNSQLKITRFDSKSHDPIESIIKGNNSSTVGVTKSRKKNNSLTTITNIRHWSNPNYTRVVIDAEDEITYKKTFIKKNPKLNKPPRLFFDIHNARLGKNLKTKIPIKDNLLDNIRIAQYSTDSVRAVIDIKSYSDFKIFSLKTPDRVVIDVWGKRKPVDQRVASTNANKYNTKIKPVNGSTLIESLALGVKTIVIDPGHGGKDPGAGGYYKGDYERDIVLSISKKVAAKIKQKLNCNVLLTRSTNRYLTLEERTAFANTKNADLFISIHTNSARNRKAYGIETYFLNLATDDAAIAVAARENATSTKNISDLQSILNDLMRNTKINESSRLADHVQSSMFQGLKKNNYKYIKNKGVKQAPFYVLLGAQMPAILVETSFISNQRENKRLKNKKYQDLLSDYIVEGISKYIKEMHP